MASVYVLQGVLGATLYRTAVDLNARLAQHRRGHTYATRRLGEKLEFVASKCGVRIADTESVRVLATNVGVAD